MAPYDLAVIYAGLKDRDQTWKYLEMAYEDHSYAIILLRADPRFAQFRSEPVTKTSFGACISFAR